jgi:ElaB/YqjD/DUF883 family membrane-anchored ribosome-binding protein
MATSTGTYSRDAQDSMNRVEDAAKDTARSVREVAKDTGKTVRDFISDKTEQASELRKNTEEKITENPLKAVAIAGFAGIILGALLRR